MSQMQEHQDRLMRWKHLLRHHWGMAVGWRVTFVSPGVSNETPGDPEDDDEDEVEPDHRVG